MERRGGPADPPANHEVIQGRMRSEDESLEEHGHGGE